VSNFRGPVHCCASTSPKARTSHAGPPKTLKQWPLLSTTDPERASTGRLPRRSSRSSYALFTNPVLQRPVEPRQFGSWAFTQRAKKSGLVPAMGSIGIYHHNGLLESLWLRMQVEFLDRHRWKTRTDLANTNFDYLEIWHNRCRLHSALDWVSRVK
jgi:transposase InsO family protein